ncbi:choline transporter-like protein 1 isoform X2 [Bacillus rossius redtenbacheri]|uniref:choline transporter-like protein 1 isoform X2 n=1 Tax=Bacillus rossius redtenbacheri TaxID=93214 RepID=UPI002FDDFA20
MGGCCSGGDKVEPADQDTNLELAARGRGERNLGHKRGCTDVFFLLLFIAFTTSLLGLVAYCAVHGSIYRIVNGYDICGNVCGRRNAPDDLRLIAASATPSEPYCYGEDKTAYRLLQVTQAEVTPLNPVNLNRQCVSQCLPDFREYLNRCIPNATPTTKRTVITKTGIKNFFQEVSEDINTCWKEILYLCLIALAFCIVIMILFRFLVGIMVWVMLVGATLASIAGTVYLWILWNQKKKSAAEKTVDKETNGRTVNAYLAAAIVATVATVLILLVILVMRKRIALVIQLFREAGKAIASMPFLLFEPIMTFIVLGLAIATWMFFCLIIESSGFLTRVVEEKYYYQKNVLMKVTRWYNLLGLFWFLQFIIGCQHMVIAGAVSKWFFTRDKSRLGSPVGRGFGNLVQHHLGTVALGSLLIAAVQLLRVALTFLQNRLKGTDNAVSRCVFRCCQCCLCLLERFLKFFTRNAYIETAIHGTSFCASGQQAFKLLSANALRVAAINSVGDFVLFLGKAMVVSATVLIGVKMLDMTIDTIFLCFCEDCEENDGISRPYYMSRGLMEFVQNSKKVLGVESRSPSPKSPRN